MFDLVRAIESKALRVRDVRDPALATEMDDTVVTVGLPMERPLYRHRQETPLDSSQLAAGSEEFDSSALVSQVYIDRTRLAGSVWDALAGLSGLADLAPAPRSAKIFQK